MSDCRPSRRPWSHAVLLLPMVVALVVSSACNIELSSGVEARDEWKRSYPLAQGGTFEIRNTNGRIRITSVDGDTIEVKADRIVKAATDEAAKAALKQFEITESVSPKSVTIDGSNRGMGFTVSLQRRVDFEVRVPRWADVKLSATNGDMEVTGLRGMFRAESTNGRVVGSALEGGATVETTNGVVNLDFAKLADPGVTCETTNGTISVTVPKNTDARISARVTNGAISTSDLALAVSEQSRRRLDASIGGGGPSIKLETTNGSIAITRTLGRALADLRDQLGQDRAGTGLFELRHTFAEQEQHRVEPSDRAGDLPGQRLPNRSGAVGTRGQIGDDRDRRRLELTLLEERRERLLRGAHVARMEGRAHVERDDSPSGGLKRRLDLGELRFWSGDDRLLEGIEIGDVERAACGIFLEHPLNRLRIEADDCRHPGALHFVHQPAALLDQPDAGAKVEDACREQRVVFTQAVARDERRRRPIALVPGAKRHRVHDKQRRLCEVGASEHPARVLETQVADGISEDGVRVARPLGEPIEQIAAHAFGL